MMCFNIDLDFQSIINQKGAESMLETGRSEVIDLVKKKIDNLNLVSRKDDKSVFLSFGYTTIDMPVEEVKPFLDFMIETKEELIDFRSEEVSIMPLAEKKTDSFKFSSWKDCEVVYLSFGHTMITISHDDFTAVCDFIKDTSNKLNGRPLI